MTALSLRSGIVIGLATGAGVAVVDTLYAAAGAAGAAGLLAVEPLRVAFGLIGAAVLIALDRAAGVGLLGFGGLLAYRTLRD